MPKLYDKSNDRLLGEISQQDLDLLIAQFAEESSRDRGCCVDNDTFLALADAGASSRLLDALKAVLDANGEGDVRWEVD